MGRLKRLDVIEAKICSARARIAARRQALNLRAIEIFSGGLGLDEPAQTELSTEQLSAVFLHDDIRV